MIQHLSLEMVTAFRGATLHFCPGINVIIGQNGTGKTHLLKIAYAFSNTYKAMLADGGAVPDDVYLQEDLPRCLVRSLRIKNIRQIVRHEEPFAAMSCSIDHRRLGIRIRKAPFEQERTVSAQAQKQDPTRLENNSALSIYLPPQELLSIAHDLPPIYAARYLPIDQTWNDACLAMTAPLSTTVAGTPLFQDAVRPLEIAMGGRIEINEAGRFIFKGIEGERDICLIADGFRKLGSLAQILATEQLTVGGTLFWDEPEANLNPALIRVAAQVIMALGQHGVQVILATHSVFLLRELYILRHAMPAFATVSMRYMGLTRAADEVAVTQGDSIEDLPSVMALDEELIQADRYMDVANGLPPQPVDRR